jgi:ACT domain-containing protein
LKKIVDSTFSNLSEEKRIGITNFLSQQDIEKQDELISSFLVIQKLYEKFPNLIFNFDHSIKNEKFEISTMFTDDQAGDLSIMGVDIVKSIRSSMINYLVISVTKQLSESKTNYISTSGKFFIFSRNVFDGNTENRIRLTFKILTIADLRKMKLEKLNRTPIIIDLNNFFPLRYKFCI